MEVDEPLYEASSIFTFERPGPKRAETDEMDDVSSNKTSKQRKKLTIQTKLSKTK